MQCLERARTVTGHSGSIEDPKDRREEGVFTNHCTIDLELEIEAARNPGAFIPNRACFSFVSDLDRKTPHGSMAGHDLAAFKRDLLARLGRGNEALDEAWADYRPSTWNI